MSTAPLDPAHRPRKRLVRPLAWLLIALAPAWIATALAQTPDSQQRSEVVLGVSVPMPDEYAGDDMGASRRIPTVRVPARIPGLPVRQHPVNVGRFASGCAQCHRLAGPLPPASEAPTDVFEQLNVPPVAEPPPPRFTRVTSTAAREERPAWRPDGQALLYEARNDEGGYDLWLVEASGGEPQRLTHHASAGWAEWHPSGERIVYWASDAPGRSDLWLYELDTRASRRLTDHRMTAWPTWHPDGAWVAYQALDDQGWRLRLLNVRTGEGRDVTRPADDMPSRPLWSPDGRELLYQSIAQGSFELTRMVFSTDAAGAVDLAATPQRRATPTEFPIDLGAAPHAAAWNPAGDRIAYATYALDVIPMVGLAYSYKTFISNPGGGYPRQLVPEGTLADRSATWSPDGEWLAQWSWGTDLHAGVWLVNADATRRVQLTDDLGGDALYPAWSPDGTRIAFASNRSGDFDLWTADVTDLVGGDGAEEEAATARP